jgi:pimeloyl-ACP methyl ester carboxylesterase
MSKLDTQAELHTRLARLYHDRVQAAAKAYVDATTAAGRQLTEGIAARALDPASSWKDAAAYWVDFGQRTALFWDTMRQRGDDWLEHEKAGKPVLLKFPHETIADARTFERPVNYALLRILPGEDTPVDPRRRPFVIIDPRAGHGPGIGGFKADSEVGVAMKAGHAVYFVTFFPQPEPGQTLADVSRVEAEFLRIVRKRHPDTGRPILIGNCQGGWAAMLVGAMEPELVGPIVINGAPMSYWAGNDAENPMRYSGGLLGGVWPALLSSDLGGGIFDGADLVSNFENANPANTLVDKYYTLFSRIDTEPPRFLEFERWWGGYFLMNRAEIKWIVENLFVGNRLAAGEAEWSEGRAFDLRSIRSPIVVFASLGDNITPPQQAINWVLDLYPTTEALKANGQVIVGLVHRSIGHLGIFVSGGVAVKEHAQIVELLHQIETLPPGLYAMQIDERKDAKGKVAYDVTLTEHKVEDLRRIQKYDRKDEIPFEAVAEVSEVNETFYEAFVSPLVKAMVSPAAATAMRAFHPLRLQRWALSSQNPMMASVKAAAEMARSARAPRDPAGPAALAERHAVSSASHALELYRAIRDATGEYLFFSVYGAMSMAKALASPKAAARTAAHEEDVPGEDYVRAAIARAGQGDFYDAVARMAIMAMKAGTGRRRLSTAQTALGIIADGAGVVGINPETVRERVREQAAIVEFAPERAAATLPDLLPEKDDRARALAIFEKLGETLDLNAAQQALLREFSVRLSPTHGSDGDNVVALDAPSARRKAGRRAQA